MPFPSPLLPSPPLSPPVDRRFLKTVSLYTGFPLHPAPSKPLHRKQMVHAIAELRKSLDETCKYRMVIVSRGRSALSRIMSVYSWKSRGERERENVSVRLPPIARPGMPLALGSKRGNKFSCALCAWPITPNLDRERNGEIDTGVFRGGKKHRRVMPYRYLKFSCARQPTARALRLSIGLE